MQPNALSASPASSSRPIGGAYAPGSVASSCATSWKQRSTFSQSAYSMNSAREFDRLWRVGSDLGRHDALLASLYRSCKVIVVRPASIRDCSILALRARPSAAHAVNSSSHPPILSSVSG
jgi:hypothetical protein